MFAGVRVLAAERRTRGAFFEGVGMAGSGKDYLSLPTPARSVSPGEAR